MTRDAHYILAVSVPFVASSLLSAVLSVGFYAGCIAFAFSVPSLNGHLRDTWWFLLESLHLKAKMFLQSQELYISNMLAF